MKTNNCKGPNSRLAECQVPDPPRPAPKPAPRPALPRPDPMVAVRALANALLAVMHSNTRVYRVMRELVSKYCKPVKRRRR